ncbi:MAG TPA: hypothetical protein VFZ01_03700 [Geminicoccaceae bacterium]
MGEHEFFRIVALVAVLLLVLPAAFPSMRANARRIRLLGVWVLVFGMVVAGVLIVEWLLGRGP